METKYKTERINQINQSFDYKIDLINDNKFDFWQIKDLLPSGKKHCNDKEYLLKRVEKLRQKELLKFEIEYNNIINTPDFVTLIIEVEWKRSATWGMNPTAEMRIWNKDGFESIYIAKASGCGYCKQSAVVAEVLNKSLSLQKLCIEAYDKDLKSYGLRPSGFASGGVGISSLQNAFEVLGLKLEHVASGKTYDKFVINI